MNKYFDKKIVDWWIEDLVNWCDEQDNGGGAGGLTDEGLVSLTGHFLSEWFIFFSKSSKMSNKIAHWPIFLKIEEWVQIGNWASNVQQSYIRKLFWWLYCWILGWALFGKFWTVKKLFTPLKDIYPWITKLVSKWL